jgi:site-specific recombinase XerD
MKRRLPEILTEKEENSLLSQFNNRYYTSHRNRLMIRLALATGMRISELISLRFEDITPQAGVFKVHIKQAKGDKDRMVFISGKVYMNLIDMHEAHDFSGAGTVFPTTKGDMIKDAYLRKMIKRKGIAAGIPRLHFHLLRHTYLTRTYTRTKDIRVVQEIAGHASINTTMIYTHTSGEAVRAAMVGA